MFPKARLQAVVFLLPFAESCILDVPRTEIFGHASRSAVIDLPPDIIAPRVPPVMRNYISTFEFLRSETLVLPDEFFHDSFLLGRVDPRSPRNLGISDFGLPPDQIFLVRPDFFWPG